MLLFISYYVYYKRHLSHRPHSDEFISVAYLDEDDAVVPKFSDLSRSGRLLNLTDFQYNIQPKLCVEKNQNLLGTKKQMSRSSCNIHIKITLQPFY